MKILGFIITCFAIVAGVILFKNGSLGELADIVDDKIGGIAHSFTDSRDGQSYRTVSIGTQTWMAENLNFAYNHATAKSFCYDDLPENCDKYGRLYNRAAAVDSAGILGSGEGQGVCPNGWRLPSVEDWEKLAAYIGISGAGIKLKTKTGWNNGGNGTDEFDFSAFPAGFREKRKYKSEGYAATFWTVTVANNKALADVGRAYGNHYVATNNTYSLNAAFWISAMNPERSKIAYLAGNINGIEISNATGSHSIRCIKNDDAKSSENSQNSTVAGAAKMSSGGANTEKASKEIKDMIKAYVALQNAYCSEVGTVGSLSEIGFDFKKYSYFDYNDADAQKGLSVTPRKKIDGCLVGKKIAVYPHLKNGDEYPQYKCRIDAECEFLATSLRSVCR